MGKIASINFKKSIAINTAHNDRTLAPSYLISDEGVECNRTDERARELKNQIIAKAKETYTNRTGQKFQAKSYEWSAVCNIKPDTTMSDLENLAAHLQDKYGFQCYQISIHRDEGHIDEQGQKQINHHAHLEFITLDKNTGINRQRELTPQRLRELQSEVSQILEMQRGEDKRKTGRKRIEPRAYAKQKETEKANSKNLTKKAVKAELEKIRKSCIGKGYGKDFFRELNALNQETYTAETLANAINSIFDKYNNELELKSQKVELLEIEQIENQQTIQKLKSEIVYNQSEMAQISTNATELDEIITQANEMAKIASIELEYNETPKKPSFWNKLSTAYLKAKEKINELLHLDEIVNRICKLLNTNINNLENDIKDLQEGKNKADNVLSNIENSLDLDFSEQYEDCENKIISAIKSKDKLIDELTQKVKNINIFDKMREELERKNKVFAPDDTIKPKEKTNTFTRHR